MLKIEFDPPQETRCECCSEASVHLTRFVYQDDDAYAIYKARFSPAHPEKPIIMTISIGEWGEGTDSSARVSFAMVLRNEPNQYGFELIDAELSPWRELSVIGTTLSRSEALSHPRLAEVWHIADHAVAEDETIRCQLVASTGA